MSMNFTSSYKIADIFLVVKKINYTYTVVVLIFLNGSSWIFDKLRGWISTGGWGNSENFCIILETSVILHLQ